MSTASKNSSSAPKRLLHELRSYEEEPNPALQRLGPVNDDELLEWSAIMKGVAGTAYEGLHSRILLAPPMGQQGIVELTEAS